MQFVGINWNLCCYFNINRLMITVTGADKVQVQSAPQLMKNDGINVPKTCTIRS